MPHPALFSLTLVYKFIQTPFLQMPFFKKQKNLQ